MTNNELLALTFTTLTAVGCGDNPMMEPDTDGSTADADAGRTDPETDGGTIEETDGGTIVEGEWTLRSHPCPGINRTDALMVDADGSIWIGCGSGAAGGGLYVSDDDGASWEVPATSPANVLGGFRVLSIHRGYNDLVYVAGEGPASTMVVSLDTSATPYAVTAVLTRAPRVGYSFLASPFVTTASGRAFADSFVGHDALYRPDPSLGDDPLTWTDASGWEDDGGASHQILDMVAVGEDFYGCGSTISEPPFVFLPSRTGEPYQMTPVQLVSGLGGWGGELWGIAASQDRVVTVGVDQGSHIGKIFVSGDDLYDAADYTQIDVDPLVARAAGGDSTWSRGVCMRGDRIVVVGEVQPLGANDNTGFVLESNDGGATFVDRTPEGSPDTWSKCSIETSGRLVLAGAGMIAIED
jgi:hypothetical protein